MKTARQISDRLCLPVRFLRLFVLLFLFPTAAVATNVAVDCATGGSINAALASLDSVGPHTITVTGTCTEDVNVNLRNQLTIQAPYCLHL
jgi:hypothetical protein